MRSAQLLEKIDFEFDSPLDPAYSVKVYKNPNFLEMVSVRKRTTFQELRGLILGNIVYIWDANLATHDNLIEELAPNTTTIMKFIIGSDNELISAEMDISVEKIMSNPMMQRMMRNNK